MAASALTKKVSYLDKDGEKVTKTTHDAVVDAVEVGVPRKFAAQAAGVAESTVSLWLKKGRELRQRVAGGIVKLGDLTKSERAYLDFSEDIEKAEGRFVVNAMQIIAEHAPKTWPAAMTALERRHPRYFARRVEIDTDPTGDREPAEIDEPLAAEAEKSFRAAHLPEGVELDDVLPELAGDE